MAEPGSGLISDRSRTDGPKMYLALLGWFRSVLDLNAESRKRLRPSDYLSRTGFRLPTEPE